MRALVVDAAAVTLLSIYGTEVCPLLEGMGLPSVAIDIAGAFLLAHAIGRVLDARWVDRANEVQRASRTYVVTLARYALAGLFVLAFDTVVMHFALGSGAKVIVGTLALGHFAGVDLALAKERRVMDDLTAGGHALSTIERPRSFVRRVLVFALGAVVAASLVLAFVLARDLEILEGSGRAAMASTHRSIMTELAFVGGALIALSASLVTSFAQNLRRFLENETRVLDAVTRGELDRGVPVLSDDEFGVIAAHTNRMIEGLRERRRVREVLGKIASPEIARALLDERGLSLGGERRTLVLLFSDVRDFTTWSEATDPEVLVRDLNTYFTAMVTIVHERGGVVDKFIGDGMMAVFGLDGRDDAASAAAQAGEAMLDALPTLALSHAIGIGIGIHRGEVVAGNIGSPDRLEYTFIGDAVNTAARVESLTRKVDAPLLVTRAVFDALTEADRARWGSRGAHPLQGKSEPIEVFAPAA